MQPLTFCTSPGQVASAYLLNKSVDKPTAIVTLKGARYISRADFHTSGKANLGSHIHRSHHQDKAHTWTLAAYVLMDEMKHWQNDKRCFLHTFQCDQGPNTKVQAHNTASNGWNETLEQRRYWKVSSIIRNVLQAHSKLGKQWVTSSILCELWWIWREEFQENNWYKAYNAAQYNWIT